MAEHRVVGHDAWVEARKKHLAKEKEFTRLHDQLSRERRELPWELVEKEYTFEGERGAQTLSELFDGHSQLVVYHAMFNDTARPNTTWTVDAACFSCSYWMDNFNCVTVHLNHRDITMVAVSRAPYPAIAAYRKRMGWGFPWLSSVGGDFNFDYRVSLTEDELAAGHVDYNYRLSPFPMSEAPGAAGCRLRGVRSAGAVILAELEGAFHDVTVEDDCLSASRPARFICAFLPGVFNDATSRGLSAGFRRRRCLGAGLLRRPGPG